MIIVDEVKIDVENDSHKTHDPTATGKSVTNSMAGNKTLPTQLQVIKHKKITSLHSLT